MPTLQSKAIKHVSYDAVTAQLYITFHSGGPYTFYRVPSAIYHGLVTTEFPREYYHAYIRGRYGRAR